jgi:hypothetical protein
MIRKFVRAKKILHVVTIRFLPSFSWFTKEKKIESRRIYIPRL